MKMSKFIAQITADLKNLSQLGGSEMESVVSRLIPAMEPVLRTRLLEVVSEFTDELKLKLQDVQLDVLIAGDEVEVASLTKEDPFTKGFPPDLNARITLRLPEELKSRIEAAAAAEGISLNSWLLKATERTSLSISIGGRQIKGKGRS